MAPLSEKLRPLIRIETESPEVLKRLRFVQITERGRRSATVFSPDVGITKESLQDAGKAYREAVSLATTPIIRKRTLVLFNTYILPLGSKRIL